MSSISWLNNSSEAAGPSGSIHTEASNDVWDFYWSFIWFLTFFYFCDWLWLDAQRGAQLRVFNFETQWDTFQSPCCRSAVLLLYNHHLCALWHIFTASLKLSKLWCVFLVFISAARLLFTITETLPPSAGLKLLTRTSSAGCKWFHWETSYRATLTSHLPLLVLLQGSGMLDSLS